MPEFCHVIRQQKVQPVMLELHPLLTDVFATGENQRGEFERSDDLSARDRQISYLSETDPFFFLFFSPFVPPAIPLFLVFCCPVLARSFLFSCLQLRNGTLTLCETIISRACIPACNADKIFTTLHGSSILFSAFISSLYIWNVVARDLHGSLVLIE